MIDVRTGGHATEDDLPPVHAELEKFPGSELAALAAGGIGMVVCRESVVDYRPDLATEHPRNWPPGVNWSVVPGCYAPDEHNVIIATIGAPGGGRIVPPTGTKHSSWNLVLHETMHGDDYLAARRRCYNSEFVLALDEDRDRLPEYEKGKDQAGHEESYAETAARYFGGDPAMPGQVPALYAFWAAASLPVLPGSVSRGGTLERAAIGTATLLDNGNIELDLRAESSTGLIGHALFEVEPGHPTHRAVRERLGPARRDVGASRTVLLDGF